jgi:hypothetical protein
MKHRRNKERSGTNERIRKRRTWKGAAIVLHVIL